MYFSLVKICFDIVSCHFLFPAPFRMPSASSDLFIFKKPSPLKVLAVNSFYNLCLLWVNDKVPIFVLGVAQEPIVVDLHFSLLVAEL